MILCFSLSQALFGSLLLITEFALILKMFSLLNLPPTFITLHSFRRSRATIAFNHNVSLQQIQRHGTWTSDCVWRYVCDSMDAGSEVASNFASLLS